MQISQTCLDFKCNNTPGIRHSSRYMFFIILVTGLSSIFFGERIPVSNGFGWDGIFYGELVKNFNISGLSTYQTQRIFPSAIVHYILTPLNLPLENFYVVNGFAFYNLLLLLLSCYLWRLIAVEIGLSEKSFWLGFIGLFINFANVKFAFYYPVLTDVTSFTLTLLMLLCYLQNRVTSLCLVTLIGAFTWPILLYSGLLLILFRKNQLNTHDYKTSSLSILAALFATGFVSYYIVDLYIIKGITDVGSGTAPIVTWLAPLNIIACLSYLFVAIKSLFDGINFRNVLQYLRQITYSRVFLALLVLFVAKTIVYILADPNQPATSLEFIIHTFVLCSITRPFIFLVSHSLYFGSIFFILLFLWKPYVYTIRQYGFGLLLLMALGILMSITPESRHSTVTFTVTVPFLVKATDNLKWKVQLYWYFGIISVCLSKFWYKINVAPLEGSPLEFPFQHYFMNFGPWMSNQMYGIQGAIVIVLGILLHCLIRKNTE